MFTKNINFINFNIKKLVNAKKKIIKFQETNWHEKYPLLKCYSNNYNYSYTKKNINKIKKFKSFSVIGMGGSVLGTEAIYQFLKHKIKKNSNL